MNYPYRKFVAYAAIILLAVACQKELSTETPQDPDPDPLAKKCRVTEASNMQWSNTDEDSTSFTKFLYDTLGRVDRVVTVAGDTHRYTYSANEIIVEEPTTWAPGGTQIADYWTMRFVLDAKGQAKYYTTDYNGWTITDSTVLTYDANGYLIKQQVYDLSPAGDDYTVTYTYTNGNMTKAVFNPTYNYFPDSIVVKYSDIDVKADVLNFYTSDKYRDDVYYPWTGKQNKKLPSQTTYYYPWEAITSKIDYVMGADGMPTIFRGKSSSTARPGQENVDAAYVKYKCE